MGNQSCERYRVEATLSLDNELADREKRALRVHLSRCAECRNAFNEARWIRKSIRNAAPLYFASPALRAEIGAMLADVAKKPEATLESSAVTRRARRGSTFVTRWLGGAVAAGALIVAAIWGSNALLAPAHAGSFTRMAADAHKRFQLGQLPLEIATAHSHEISKWFVDKVPFAVKLPSYQDVSDEPAQYRIEGGRLVGFDGDYAAYVAYEMERNPISLVITSNAVDMAADGERFSVKGIDFHYETIDGLKVITWSHRGLTYALVSELEERGERSCMVCHQGATDGLFKEGFGFLVHPPPLSER